MPILKDSRPVKTLTLPESKITLTIKDGFMAADIQAILAEQNQIAQTMILISRIIIDWDAEDENGQKLAVTADNVSLVPISDLKYIQENMELAQDFLGKATKPDTK